MQMNKTIKSKENEKLYLKGNIIMVSYMSML